MTPFFFFGRFGSVELVFISYIQEGKEVGKKFLRRSYAPFVENEAATAKKRTNNIFWLVPCDSGSSGHGDRLSCYCLTRPPWSAHIPVLPTDLAVVVVVVQDAPAPRLWTCQAQHSPGHQ